MLWLVLLIIGIAFLLGTLAFTPPRTTVFRSIGLVFIFFALIVLLLNYLGGFHIGH